MDFFISTSITLIEISKSKHIEMIEECNKVFDELDFVHETKKVTKNYKV